MRTVGRYTLLHRLALGQTTETWLAAGALQVTFVLPAMRDQRWVDAQLDRVGQGAALPDPWPRTVFWGREAGEAVHVQAFRGGVHLFDVLRGGGLPPPIATRLALELCAGLAPALKLPSPTLGVDDAQLGVGWDGALQLTGFELDRLPLLEPAHADPVFRVALVLGRMLAGRRPLHAGIAVREGPDVELPHLRPSEAPAELWRILEKNVGPQREPTCAGLARALAPHAATAAEARAHLTGVLRARFVLERTVDLARLGLCGVDALEPLPNDHVAKVVERRDAEGDWLVLGDWFQGQSHPRGELIALQLQGAVEDAGRLVERSPELRVPRQQQGIALVWRWGYVSSAAIYDLESAEALSLLLAHPSMRFLDELIIEHGDEERIAMLLSEVTPPPTLTVLHLPRRTRPVVDAVMRAWPRLKRVERSVPNPNVAAHRFL